MSIWFPCVGTLGSRRISAADLGWNPGLICPDTSFFSQGRFLKEVGRSRAILFTAEGTCGKEERSWHGPLLCPRSLNDRAGLSLSKAIPTSGCLLRLLSKIALEVFYQNKLQEPTNLILLPTPPPLLKEWVFLSSGSVDFNTELDVVQKIPLNIFLTNPCPRPEIVPLKPEGLPF